MDKQTKVGRAFTSPVERGKYYTRFTRRGIVTRDIAIVSRADVERDAPPPLVAAILNGQRVETGHYIYEPAD